MRCGRSRRRERGDGSGERREEWGGKRNGGRLRETEWREVEGKREVGREGGREGG